MFDFHTTSLMAVISFYASLCKLKRDNQIKHAKTQFFLQIVLDSGLKSGFTATYLKLVFPALADSFFVRRRVGWGTDSFREQMLKKLDVSIIFYTRT